MIVFLDVEDVKQIHAEQIDAFGGSHGVRDEGALESAVNQAQATFGEEYLNSRSDPATTPSTPIPFVTWRSREFLPGPSAPTSRHRVAPAFASRSTVA